MNNILIRNDDVNPNSNFEDIFEMYALLKKYIPNVKIYSAINIFSKESPNHSAYPQIELKDTKPLEIDQIFDLSLLPKLENVISHGLFHTDHRNLGVDFQTYSIVASCNLLKTKTFIPPYWRWNSTTEDICNNYGINLWINGDWINLDTNDFKEGHTEYIMHSWRLTPKQLEDKLILCYNK